MPRPIHSLKSFSFTNLLTGNVCFHSFLCILTAFPFTYLFLFLSYIIFILSYCSFDWFFFFWIFELSFIILLSLFSCPYIYNVLSLSLFSLVFAVSGPEFTFLIPLMDHSFNTGSRLLQNRKLAPPTSEGSLFKAEIFDSSILYSGYKNSTPEVDSFQHRK